LDNGIGDTNVQLFASEVSGLIDCAS